MLFMNSFFRAIASKWFSRFSHTLVIIYCVTWFFVYAALCFAQESSILHLWYILQDKSEFDRSKGLAGMFVGPYFLIQFWPRTSATWLWPARLLCDRSPSCWNEVSSEKVMNQIGCKSLVLTIIFFCHNLVVKVIRVKHPFAMNCAPHRKCVAVPLALLYFSWDLCLSWFALFEYFYSRYAKCRHIWREYAT